VAKLSAAVEEDCAYLRDRLLELFEDKAGQPGDGEEMDDN
jgi:hypothetical protein